MKKTISMLLTAAMLLGVAPLSLSVSAYEDSQIAAMEASLQSTDNLAYNKTVIHDGTALDQGEGSSWTPGNLTDGTLNYNSSTHETTGYHSQHGTDGCKKNHLEWVGIDLGEETEFDTLVVYPNRPQDSDYNGSTCPSFPNAFRVEVSNDGTSWTELIISVNGDDANAATTIYNFDPPAPEPVTIHFTAVRAKYVRFVGVSLNYIADGFYMKLTEMALYNTGYEPSPYVTYENVVANKPLSIPVGGAHYDPSNSWIAGNINNGNRYDMVTNTANNDYGQFAGFHGSASRPTEITLDFTLDEGTTLNQVVIYPASEKYAGTQNATTFYFPANFTFEISDNGEDWTVVKSVTGYSVSEYAPQVFDLDQVYTAHYLRFAMTGISGYIKLSELEAYDTTKPVTVEYKAPFLSEQNLAEGTSVICSSVINSGGWNIVNLTNGIIEENGGFTSGRNDSDANPTVGLDLGVVARVNAITLWSAKSDDERDAEWSGIPQTFEIQVSSNGFNWETVGTYTNESVPEFGKGYTYSFDAIDARYIRIATSEGNLYPKGSDYNYKYIQLAEMEVSYTPVLSVGNNDNNTLSTENISAWVSTRENEADAGVFDMRFVLVTDETAVQLGDTVTITFYADNEVVKEITRTIGEEMVAGQTMALYSEVSAAGQDYTAEEGCRIFGCVVTGIPKDGFTTVTMSVTRNDGQKVMKDASGSNPFLSDEQA